MSHTLDDATRPLGRQHRIRRIALKGTPDVSRPSHGDFMSGVSASLGDKQVIPSTLVVDVRTLRHFSRCPRPDILHLGEELSRDNVNLSLPDHRRGMLVIRMDPASLDVDFPVRVEEETRVYPVEVEVGGLAVGTRIRRSVAVMIKFDG